MAVVEGRGTCVAAFPLARGGVSKRPAQTAVPSRVRNPKDMQMKRLTLLWLPVLSLACTETVESTDVRTSGVYPEFRVVADGSGSSQVSARLKVGGNDSNTFLDLKDDDRIEVTVGEETRRLEETGSHSYTAIFPTD